MHPYPDNAERLVRELPAVVLTSFKGSKERVVAAARAAQGSWVPIHVIRTRHVRHVAGSVDDGAPLQMRWGRSTSERIADLGRCWRRGRPNDHHAIEA